MNTMMLMFALLALSSHMQPASAGLSRYLSCLTSSSCGLLGLLTCIGPPSEQSRRQENHNRSDGRRDNSPSLSGDSAQEMIENLEQLAKNGNKLDSNLKLLHRLNQCTKSTNNCGQNCSEITSECMRTMRTSKYSTLVEYLMLEHAKLCARIYLGRLKVDEQDEMVLRLLMDITDGHLSLDAPDQDYDAEKSSVASYVSVAQFVEWPEGNDKGWGSHLNGLIHRFGKGDPDVGHLDTRMDSDQMSNSLVAAIENLYEKYIDGPCKQYISRNELAFSGAEFDIGIYQREQNLTSVFNEDERSLLLRQHAMLDQCKNIVASKQALLGSLYAFKMRFKTLAKSS